MKHSFTHVKSLDEVPERKPTFLAIGSFDGVHIGHQAILHRLIAAGRALDVQTAVLTFFPHPKRVVQKLTGPYYLSTLEDRIDFIASLGIDLLITHPFDKSVQHTKAADFMAQIMAAMDLRQLWGGNIVLGHNREGDIPFLRRLGESVGFTVETNETLVQWQGEVVSSSRIRRSLNAGDIFDVTGCLGRPYQLVGPVVMGDQRGRTIGFPTANIDIWEKQLLPANGVYATYAAVDNKRFMAATNIGVRPTVDGQSIKVEAHLLDFDGDLYDKRVRLYFIERIRPEKKFSGLDTLKAQIQADTEQVRTILLKAQAASQP